jgi:hypothetical protein
MVRCLVSWIVALTLPLVVFAADTKKPSKSEPEKERLVPAGQLFGEIISNKVEGGTFKLRIHSKQPEIKWNQSMPRPGDLGSLRNAMLERMRGGGASVNLKDANTDVDVTLAEDAKIRIPLKPEVDDKGKVKPESLKPDPKDPDRRLGGAKGTEKDLGKGQWVLLDLGATREKPPRILATAVRVVAEKKQ